MTVIAVYAPTNSTVEACTPCLAFYDQLHTVLAFVPYRGMIIVLGDFKARVGLGRGNFEFILEPHS